MATEADIPEPVPLMEGGINRHLKPGEFDHLPETADFVVKPELVEVLSIVDVKTTNSNLETNAGATEGVSFFESPSISKVSEEQNREIQETHQVDGFPREAEKEISEIESPIMQEENAKATEDMGKKETEVLQVVEDVEVNKEKIEEPCLKIVEEKTSTEEEIVHSIEVNPEIVDKQILPSDSPVDGGIKEEDVKLKATEEATEFEPSSDPNEEVLACTSQNLDTDVETPKDACLDKNDKGINSDQLVEKTESEKECVNHDDIEESSTIVATSPEIENAGDANAETDIPAVALVTDKPSTREVEVVPEAEKNSSIVSEVEGHIINDSNRKAEGDETEEKINVEIPSAPLTEEICLQKADETEIRKEVSETCPENVKITPEDCQTEIVDEKTGAENANNEANLEQKLDVSVAKQEGQVVSEAIAEERKDELKQAVVDDDTKDEAENNKIQESPAVVSKELEETASRECSETIIHAEETLIENQVDKVKKEDESIDSETIRDEKNPKDLPPTELHEKVEISEADSSNKNEDGLNTNYSQEIATVEGEEPIAVSDVKPVERGEDGVAKDEKEVDDNESQAPENATQPIVEVPSEKEVVSTEPSSETSETDIEISKEVQKSDSEEKLDTTDVEKSTEETKDREKPDTTDVEKSTEETKAEEKPDTADVEKSTGETKAKEKPDTTDVKTSTEAAKVEEKDATDVEKSTEETKDEASETHIQNLPSSGDTEKCDVEEKTSDEVGTVALDQETIERNVSAENPQEATTPLKDDVEEIEKAKSITSEENLPTTELNDKTEIAEVEISTETPSVSDLELQDQAQKPNEAPKDDEKHGDNDSLEHAFVEGTASTEPIPEPETSEIDSEKSENIPELDAEKNIQTTDPEIIVKEDKQESEEACQTEVHALATTSDGVQSYTEEVAPDGTASVLETIERSFPMESLQEASTTLNNEVKFGEDTKSTINEEITGIDKVTNEQEKIESTAHLSSETTNEETVESSEQTEKDSEEYKREEVEGQSAEGNTASDISQESVRQDASKISQNDEDSTENSSNTEVAEKSAAAETVDYLVPEAKKIDESLKLDNEQESQQIQNLIVAEASSTERNADDGSSTQKDEDKDYDTGVVTEVEEKNEVILDSEEDLKQTTQISEDTIEQPQNVIPADLEVSTLSRIETNAVEEVAENPQINEREGEIENHEEVVNESNIKSLTQDPAEDFHNDAANEEKSNEEIFEKPEVAETSDGIVTEAKIKMTDKKPEKDEGQENQEAQHQTVHETSKEDDLVLAEVQKSNVMSKEAQKTDDSPDTTKEQENQESQNLTLVEDSEKYEADVQESNVISAEPETKITDESLDIVKEQEIPETRDLIVLEASEKDDSLSAEVQESNVITAEPEAKTVDESLDTVKEQENQETQDLTVLEASEKDDAVLAEVHESSETSAEPEEKTTVESPDKVEEQENQETQDQAVLEASKENDSVQTEVQESNQSAEPEGKTTDERPDAVKESENQETRDLTVHEGSEKDDSVLEEVHESNVIPTETEAKTTDESQDKVEEQELQETQTVLETSKEDDSVLAEVQESSVISEEPETKMTDESPDAVKELKNHETQNLAVLEPSEKDDSAVAEVQESNAISEKPEAKTIDESPDTVKEQESQETQNLTALECSEKDDSAVAEIQESNVVTEEPKAQTIGETPDKVEEQNTEETQAQTVLETSKEDDLLPEVQESNVISAELEAGLTTDDKIVECEESPQGNEREVEISKDEVAIIERNVESHSQESGAKDLVVSQNDDNDAEKSKTEIFEKSVTAETVDAIVTEAKQSGDTPDLIKEPENTQSQNETTPEASVIERIDEDGTLIEKDEDKENEVPQVEHHNEETLKVEESTELQKSKPGENIQQPLNTIATEPDADGSIQGHDATEEDAQCNERDLQLEKGEDVVNESNINSLSSESVAENPQDVHQDEDKAEKENTEIFENPEPAETGNSIIAEGEKSDERIDLVKDHEILKTEEVKTVEASSVEKIGEDESEDTETKTDHEEIQHNEVTRQQSNAVSTETEVSDLIQLKDESVNEQVEQPKGNENVLETAKDEDITSENEVKRVSREFVVEDFVKNPQTDDSPHEKLNAEILKTSDASQTDENNSRETNEIDKSICDTSSSSPAEAVESPEVEGKNIQEKVSVEETSETADHVTHEAIENNDSLNSSLQASTVGEQKSDPRDDENLPEVTLKDEKAESGSSPKPYEEDEKITEAEELKVQDTDEPLDGGIDLEQAVPKVEPREDLEPSIIVLSAEAEPNTSSEIVNPPEKKIDENLQKNTEDSEVPKVEDDTREHITDDQNIESLSNESAEQGTVDILQNEEHDAEVSNIELLESVEDKSSESAALANTTHPVEPIKEEEFPEEKSKDPVEALPDEKKEDEASSLKKRDDNDSKTKLAEDIENSQKEIPSNGDNVELEKRESEELPGSSVDVFVPETKYAMLIEKADCAREIENTEEVLQKENKDSSEETQKPELEKNEPGELLESSPEVIDAETIASTLNDKDSAIPESTIVVENAEPTVSTGKQESDEVIEERKVEAIPTTEELKPVDETCDESTNVENKIVEEKSRSSDTEVETIEREVGSEDKQEIIETSKSSEEEIKKEDIEKVKNATPACPSEDAEKPITTEDDQTTDISAQTTQEETEINCRDQAEEKPKEEIPEEPELNKPVKDDEKQVQEEVNVEKDQPAELAVVAENDVKEAVTKKKHETTQPAESAEIGEQVSEKASTSEDCFEVPASQIEAEGPLEKKSEDENDTTETKEETKGFNSQVTEEFAAVGDEVPRDFDTLEKKQEPEFVLCPLKTSEEEIIKTKIKDSLVESSSLESESKEETSVEEVEQEDKMQLHSSDAQEKELTTADTKETILENVETDVPQDDTSNVIENREYEIPAKTCEDEEDIKHEIQNEALTTGNDKQNEVIIGEAPSDKISDDNIVEKSETSLAVLEPVTSEESEPVDVNSANDTGASENTELATSSQATELKPSEREIKTAADVSESGLVDARTENKDEQAASEHNEDLNRDLELHKEETTAEPEHSEISKIEETGDLVGDQEICEPKSSANEEALNTDRKEAVYEEENQAKKSEASSNEDDIAEKPAAELESVTEQQADETTEIKSHEFSTEENIELADSSKEFNDTSAIITRDLSSKIIPEVHPDKTEEASISEPVEQKPQESQQKIEETIEPKLEAEDCIKEPQNAETPKSEEVKNDIEKDDGVQVISQIKEEDELKQLETESASVGDEKVDEVMTSTENMKESENSEIGSFEVQTQTIVEETLNTTENEEIKVEDESVEKSVAFSTIETEKDSEIIKEQITEDADDYHEKEMTIPVAEVPVHIDDKPVETSSIPSVGCNLHAVESEASQQELHDSTVEENSSNLESQIPTNDHENVAVKSEDVVDIVETCRSSDVVLESKSHDLEELHTSEIKDEVEEASEIAHKSQDDEPVERSEVVLDQPLPEEIPKECEDASPEVLCKEEKGENKDRVDNLEEGVEQVSTTKVDSSENPSTLPIIEDIHEQHEEKRVIDKTEGEIREDRKTVPEPMCHDLIAATEDEVTDGQTLQEKKSEQYQAASPSQEQELGASTEIEKDEETEKSGEVQDDEPKTSGEVLLQQDESRELQVSNQAVDIPNEAQEEAAVTSVQIENKKDASESILSDETNLEEKAEGEHQAPHSVVLPFEQVDESSVRSMGIEDTMKETEAPEHKSKETEASGTSVETEEKKDASETMLETNSESKGEPKEDEICTVESNLEQEPQEQNQTPSSEGLSREHENKSIEESIIEEIKEMKETCLQTEEPRELEIPVLPLQVEKKEQEGSQSEISEKEDDSKYDIKEEIEEVSESIPKSSPQENVTVTERELTVDNTPTEKSEEKSQTSSAVMLSDKQEHVASATESSTEEKTREVDEPEDTPQIMEEESVENKETAELKASQIEPQHDNNVEKKCVEDLHEEAGGIPDEPLELQPEIAEEILNKRTSDETYVMPTESIKEQIKEEKEDVETHQAIALDEAATVENNQENKPKGEESLGNNILTKEIETEEIFKDAEKIDASEIIEKQITAEKGTVENIYQAVVDSETVAEHFPDGGDNVGKKLINENQDDKAIAGDGKIESISATEKELNLETAQKEGTTSLVEATSTIAGIHQEEKTDDRISEKQTSVQPESKTMTSSIEKEAPHLLQEPVIQVTRATEIEGIQPASTANISSEAKEHYESTEIENEKSHKLSLFDMMQRSTRERQTTAAEMTKDEETKKQTEETNNTKSDEEEEHEHEEHELVEEEADEDHKKNDSGSGSDAPVIVESKDIEVKSPHKKSHNILSGVGSKVKHSIIKVKKAITGKSTSSHPKQHSPK